MSEPTCRRCGCKTWDACYDEVRGACSWAEPDLCSHCKDTLDRFRELSAPAGEFEVSEDITIELKLHDAQQLQRILDYSEASGLTEIREAVRALAEVAGLEPR